MPFRTLTRYDVECQILDAARLVYLAMASVTIVARSRLVREGAQQALRM
jgi:hypothetical protein